MTAEPNAGARDRARTLVDALYREYSGALLRFLTRQGLSQEEAADVLQDSYCRMHQVPDFESIEFPKAFLFRVAGNLARNYTKRRALGIEQAGADEESANVAADQPGPYRVLAGEQQLAIVRLAFQELSPKCQQVFVMHRFGNLSYPKIAAELGLSVSMIEKYVSQALAHLKTRLTELGEA